MPLPQLTSISILLLTTLLASAQPAREPLPDLSQAALFTINEPILDQPSLDLARKVPSDLYIRGWFKWSNARDFAPLSDLPKRAHEAGALFGGGVTCSALYHGENGLTEEQVRDLATRGPSNQLVDAWGLKNVRHGTLSNPRYIDYVLSWCFKQIDAGADYLFMDELNAALHGNEGFDDYSLRDFRAYLASMHSDWTANDPRWRDQYKIDLANQSVAPDGTIQSFDYRAYLKSINAVADPLSARNPLSSHWWRFRHWRDDKAWETMANRIREYAKSKGRTVYLSGNGLTNRVDLQVLGVWGLWLARDGKIDLAESKIAHWASQVRAGRSIAGRKVPVVFFHDWGTTGFPYQQVPKAQRNLWNRIRGAEIYASGGFYAFPVHGPYGCNAERDGTLDEIIRQAKFYDAHRALYLQADFRGSECISPADQTISAALWTSQNKHDVLVHLINRKVTNDQPDQRNNVTIELPTNDLPASATAVSPDWSGQRTAKVERTDQATRLILPELTAYAVVTLHYDHEPKLDITPDRLTLIKEWSRPTVNEFRVGAFGQIADAAHLNGVLQGRLHPDLANPPTFILKAKSPAKLSVNIQAVAMQGAKIELLIDGHPIKSHDLPDQDKRNDLSANEMDVTIDLEIPKGHHRITIRNPGPDWASIRWIRFSGDFE